MKNHIIPVTKPFLAPLEEYHAYLEKVWDSQYITNNGPFVRLLEQKLQDTLQLDHLLTTSSGTSALQIAIQALDLQGDIITTAFSWIATVSAIKLEGCEPVFCDIDPNTLNIDPDKIEALITDKTVAIMPVHVFGNPCDIEAIEAIAKKHGLKVIYDGAHAIGSQYKGRSLLSYGDIAITSLHATKVLNSGEGGACITAHPELAQRIERIRCFGYDVHNTIVENGMNGKMSELHATLGLANLNYLTDILEARQQSYHIYKDALRDIHHLRFQTLIGNINHAYFPVIFDNEAIALKIKSALEEKNILPRRYFYPSLDTVAYLNAKQQCPISQDISARILCLPLFYGMTSDEQTLVIETIRSMSTK